jgi:hypothetical protein
MPGPDTLADWRLKPLAPRVVESVGPAILDLNVVVVEIGVAAAWDISDLEPCVSVFPPVC